MSLLKRKLWLIFIVLARILITVEGVVLNGTDICPSVNAVLLDDLRQLRDCKVVDGSVRLAFLDFARVSAEEYTTNIEEINGYLLVYHVHNLKTLFLLFPKLRVIRGYDLYRNLYSLVVYENLDLEALGLTNLKRIQHGMLRIIANPELCYIDTVNWRPILANYTTQTMRMWRNKWQRMCPLCSKNQTFCWDSLHAQLSYKASDQDCLEFDNKSGVCSLCANLLSDGGCVEDCKHPESLRLQRRRCVTVKQCTDIGRFVLEGDCLAHCPPERVFSRHEQHTCGRQCLGDYVIRNSGDLEQLKGCTYTIGSLVINLFNVMDTHLLAGLRNVLGHIQVIVNYLAIVNSRQLMNLDFMPNLTLIEGREQLYEGKYTLYIANNPNLENIRDGLPEFIAISGDFFIQYNQMLCVEQIEALVGKSRLPSAHPARFTNGDLAICKQIKVKLKLIKRSARALKFERELVDVNVIRNILTFYYYYRESPEQNITRNLSEMRDACGFDYWRLETLIPGFTRYIVIENLKPNTQYAIFGRAMVYERSQLEAEISTDVYYARTLPTRAKPVPKIYTGYTNATQVELHWWPPMNEQIGQYIINYKLKQPMPRPRPTNVSTKIANVAKGLIKKARRGQVYIPESACKCNTLNARISESIWHNFEVTTGHYDDFLMDMALSRLKQPEVKKIKGSIDLPKQPMPDLLPPMRKLYEIPEELVGNHRYTAAEAIKFQNNDLTRFPATSLPVCGDAELKNSSAKCLPLEHYNGTSVPGNTHSFVLTGLRPDTSYIFTIRACTLGIENGCSKPVMHTAHTTAETK